MAPVAAGAVIAAAMAGVALATPGVGVLSGAIVARASFLATEAVDLKVKVAGEPGPIQVSQAQDTAMQQLVLAPGGITGWHSHYGPAVALVKAGQLTLYSADDCSARTYGAGEAFIDTGDHVHLAKNTSSINAEVWVTYFDVPAGNTVRKDEPAPLGNCGL